MGAKAVPVPGLDVEVLAVGVHEILGACVHHP
jgi:hypothetical protein